MRKRFPIVFTTSLLAAGLALAAESPPSGEKKSPSAAAQRDASKADWLQECVAAARKRDASVTEAEAKRTCTDTTGSGGATRATMPGHSASPPPRQDTARP